MTRTTWATPTSRARPGRLCPERTRQNLPPKYAVSSIILLSLSTSFWRSAGSGCVKSGEQQSIGIARPCFSRRFRAAASASMKPE